MNPARSINLWTLPAGFWLAHKSLDPARAIESRDRVRTIDRREQRQGLSQIEVFALYQMCCIIILWFSIKAGSKRNKK